MSDDFLPTASLDHLRERSRLLARLRAYFAQHGFWEVETPLLSRDTVVDRFIDPVPVVSPLTAAPAGAQDCYWLQTSPEFGMKRLLAAGADAIYQVTRAFRREECGPLHNPEFTMVEWYRVGDDMLAGIEWLAGLASHLLQRGPVERITYRAVFEHHLGFDPHRADRETMERAAQRSRVELPESLLNRELPFDRDEWLNVLLAESIQPRLGRTTPTIVYDYPATQAALARVRLDGEVEVAERFELYVDGLELANGYHELLDANILADRQRQANGWRLADGKSALPHENRLLAAMRHGIPPCAGVALGFDRLVMACLGAERLDQVMAFPFSRA